MNSVRLFVRLSEKKRNIDLIVFIRNMITNATTIKSDRITFSICDKLSPFFNCPLPGQLSTHSAIE